MITSFHLYSIIFLTFLGLLAAKLSGYAEFSYVVVFAPLYMTLALQALIFILIECTVIGIRRHQVLMIAEAEAKFKQLQEEHTEPSPNVTPENGVAASQAAFRDAMKGGKDA